VTPPPDTGVAGVQHADHRLLPGGGQPLW